MQCKLRARLSWGTRSSANRTKTSNCSTPRLNACLHCGRVKRHTPSGPCVRLPASRPDLHLPPRPVRPPATRVCAKQPFARSPIRGWWISILYSPFLLTPPRRGDFHRGKGCTPFLNLATSSLLVFAWCKRPHPGHRRRSLGRHLAPNRYIDWMPFDALSPACSGTAEC
jgi:hypothetical protein